MLWKITALLSAVLLWAAFPPLNLWLLAWVALIPLFHVLDRVTSRRAAFGWAWLTGVAFFLLSLFWIHYVTTLGLVLLCAYLALFFGLFGLFYYYVRFRFLLSCLLLPAFWVVLEYVRSTAFTGFGWAGIGASQASFSGLIGLAAFTGVAGITFLVVAGNVIVKEIFRGGQARQVRWAGGALLVVVALVVLWTMVSCPLKRGMGLKVAVIQPNVALSEAWNPAFKGEVVRRQIELSRRALVEKPKLIIWPETAFPNFTWDRPDLLDEVKAFARDNSVYLLFGAVARDGDQYFNSAILVSPKGEILGSRGKRHLVLFGEYIPFRRQFPFLQDLVPIDDFTPGREDALFDVPGLGKFGVLICFEDTIPELARRYTLQGAQFLVNMTNDAWFRDSGQPAMHLENARFRSVENRRPLIRATNTGESCAIDAEGRERACVEDNQGRRVLISGFMVISVYPEVGMTWYAKCGEWFVLVCVAIITAAIIAALRKKKPQVVNSAKVLIIDDERSLHIMLKSILGAHGFEVVSAMNGEEGLSMAASEKPGLILLDVIMPTIKGREVCKRLKASPDTAHIPVLFLTAKDSKDDVKAELEAGAVGHVTKPINSSSLVKLIKKTIQS